MHLTKAGPGICSIRRKLVPSHWKKPPEDKERVIHHELLKFLSLPVHCWLLGNHVLFISYSQVLARGLARSSLTDDWRRRKGNHRNAEGGSLLAKAGRRKPGPSCLGLPGNSEGTRFHSIRLKPNDNWHKKTKKVRKSGARGCGLGL